MSYNPNKPLRGQSPMTRWTQGFESNSLGGYTLRTLSAIPYLAIPEAVYHLKEWKSKRADKRALKNLKELLKD